MQSIITNLRDNSSDTKLNALTDGRMHVSINIFKEHKPIPIAKRKLAKE